MWTCFGVISMEIRDVVALAVVYAIIVIALGAGLLAERKHWNVDVRKIVHIGIGNFVFIWWAFTESWIMLAFFAVPFAIILFLAMFRGNPISDSKLGELSMDRGHRTGLFFYVISITVLILFFFDHWVAASVGIIAMTYGDGFGSVVGKRYGRHRIMHGRKSLEGSLGVFVATAIMAFVILGVYSFVTVQGYCSYDYTSSIPFWIVPFVLGAVASITEMLCPGEIDNIFIPLITASVAVLLGL